MTRIHRGNRSGGNRCKRKGDVWAVYDALPAAIRAELQEGPVSLSPLGVGQFYRRQTKHYPPDDVVLYIVAVIQRNHQAIITSGDGWQPDDKRRRDPVPPHILVRATMQTSGRRLA